MVGMLQYLFAFVSHIFTLFTKRFSHGLQSKKHHSIVFGGMSGMVVGFILSFSIIYGISQDCRSAIHQLVSFKLIPVVHAAQNCPVLPPAEVAAAKANAVKKESQLRGFAKVLNQPYAITFFQYLNQLLGGSSKTANTADKTASTPLENTSSLNNISEDKVLNGQAAKEHILALARKYKGVLSTQLLSHIETAIGVGMLPKEYMSFNDGEKIQFLAGGQSSALFTPAVLQKLADYALVDPRIAIGQFSEMAAATYAEQLPQESDIRLAIVKLKEMGVNQYSLKLQLFSDGQPLWIVNTSGQSFVIRAKKTTIPIEEVRSRIASLGDTIPFTYAEQLAPGKVLLFIRNLSYDNDGEYVKLPEQASFVEKVLERFRDLGFEPDFVHESYMNLQNFMYSKFYGKMFYVDQDVFDELLKSDGIKPNDKVTRAVNSQLEELSKRSSVKTPDTAPSSVTPNPSSALNTAKQQAVVSRLKLALDGANNALVNSQRNFWFAAVGTIVFAIGMIAIMATVPWLIVPAALALLVTVPSSMFLIPNFYMSMDTNRQTLQSAQAQYISAQNDLLILERSQASATPLNISSEQAKARAQETLDAATKANNVAFNNLVFGSAATIAIVFLAVAVMMISPGLFVLPSAIALVGVVLLSSFGLFRLSSNFNTSLSTLRGTQQVVKTGVSQVISKDNPCKPTGFHLFGQVYAEGPCIILSVGGDPVATAKEGEKGEPIPSTPAQILPGSTYVVGTFDELKNVTEGKDSVGTQIKEIPSDQYVKVFPPVGATGPNNQPIQPFVVDVPTIYATQQANQPIQQQNSGAKVNMSDSSPNTTTTIRNTINRILDIRSWFPSPYSIIQNNIVLRMFAPFISPVTTSISPWSIFGRGRSEPIQEIANIVSSEEAQQYVISKYNAMISALESGAKLSSTRTTMMRAEAIAGLIASPAENIDAANRRYAMAFILMNTLVDRELAHPRQVERFFMVRTSKGIRLIYTDGKNFVTNTNPKSSTERVAVKYLTGGIKEALAYMQEYDSTVQLSDFEEVNWDASLFPFMDRTNIAPDSAKIRSKRGVEIAEDIVKKLENPPIPTAIEFAKDKLMELQPEKASSVDRALKDIAVDMNAVDGDQAVKQNAIYRKFFGDPIWQNYGLAKGYFELHVAAPKKYPLELKANSDELTDESLKAIHEWYESQQTPDEAHQERLNRGGALNMVQKIKTLLAKLGIKLPLAETDPIHNSVVVFSDDQFKLLYPDKEDANILAFYDERLGLYVIRSSANLTSNQKTELEEIKFMIAAHEAGHDMVRYIGPFMTHEWNEGMATMFMIALLVKQNGISWTEARAKVVAFVSPEYVKHLEMVEQSQFGSVLIERAFEKGFTSETVADVFLTFYKKLPNKEKMLAGATYADSTNAFTTAVTSTAQQFGIITPDQKVELWPKLYTFFVDNTVAKDLDPDTEVKFDPTTRSIGKKRVTLPILSSIPSSELFGTIAGLDRKGYALPKADFDSLDIEAPGYVLAVQNDSEAKEYLERLYRTYPGAATKPIFILVATSRRTAVSGNVLLTSNGSDLLRALDTIFQSSGPLHELRTQAKKTEVTEIRPGVYQFGSALFFVDKTTGAMAMDYAPDTSLASVQIDGRSLAQTAYVFNNTQIGISGVAYTVTTQGNAVILIKENGESVQLPIAAKSLREFPKNPGQSPLPAPVLPATQKQAAQPVVSVKQPEAVLKNPVSTSDEANVLTMKTKDGVIKVRRAELVDGKLIGHGAIIYDDPAKQIEYGATEMPIRIMFNTTDENLSGLTQETLMRELERRYVYANDVLIAWHGYLETGEQFEPAGNTVLEPWDKNGKRQMMIALSHSGTEGTYVENPDYTAKNLIAQVEAAVELVSEQINYTDEDVHITLMGHSLGGAIAFKLAEKHGLDTTGVWAKVKYIMLTPYVGDPNQLTLLNEYSLIPGVKSLGILRIINSWYLPSALRRGLLAFAHFVGFDEALFSAMMSLDLKKMDDASVRLSKDIALKNLSDAPVAIRMTQSLLNIGMVENNAPLQDLTRKSRMVVFYPGVDDTLDSAITRSFNLSRGFFQVGYDRTHNPSTASYKSHIFEVVQGLFEGFDIQKTRPGVFAQIDRRSHNFYKVVWDGLKMKFSKLSSTDPCTPTISVQIFGRVYAAGENCVIFYSNSEVETRTENGQSTGIKRNIPQSGTFRVVTQEQLTDEVLNPQTTDFKFNGKISFTNSLDGQTQNRYLVVFPSDNTPAFIIRIPDIHTQSGTQSGKVVSIDTHTNVRLDGKTWKLSYSAADTSAKLNGISLGQGDISLEKGSRNTLYVAPNYVLLIDIDPNSNELTYQKLPSDDPRVVFESLEIESLPESISPQVRERRDAAYKGDLARSILNNVDEAQDARMIEFRDGSRAFPKTPPHPAYSGETSSWKYHSEYAQKELWNSYYTSLVAALASGKSKEDIKGEVNKLLAQFRNTANLELFKEKQAFSDGLVRQLEAQPAEEFLPLTLGSAFREILNRYPLLKTIITPDQLAALKRVLIEEVKNAYMLFAASGSNAILEARGYFFPNPVKSVTTNENGSLVIDTLKKDEANTIIEIRNKDGTYKKNPVILAAYIKAIEEGAQYISFTLASKTDEGFNEILPDLAEYVYEHNRNPKYKSSPVVLMVDAVQLFGRAPESEVFQWLLVEGISGVIHTGSKAAAGPAHAGITHISTYGKTVTGTVSTVDQSIANMTTPAIVRAIGNLKAIRGMWDLGPAFQLYSPIAVALQRVYDRFFTRIGLVPIGDEEGFQRKNTFGSIRTYRLMMGWDGKTIVDAKKLLATWSPVWLMGGVLEETPLAGPLLRNGIPIGVMKWLKETVITPEDLKDPHMSAEKAANAVDDALRQVEGRMQDDLIRLAEENGVYLRIADEIAPVDQTEAAAQAALIALVNTAAKRTGVQDEGESCDPTQVGIHILPRVYAAGCKTGMTRKLYNQLITGAKLLGTRMNRIVWGRLFGKKNVFGQFKQNQVQNITSRSRLFVYSNEQMNISKYFSTEQLSDFDSIINKILDNYNKTGSYDIRHSSQQKDVININDDLTAEEKYGRMFDWTKSFFILKALQKYTKLYPFYLIGHSIIVANAALFSGTDFGTFLYQKALPWMYATVSSDIKHTAILMMISYINNLSIAGEIADMSVSELSEFNREVVNTFIKAFDRNFQLAYSNASTGLDSDELRSDAEKKILQAITINSYFPILPLPRFLTGMINQNGFMGHGTGVAFLSKALIVENRKQAISTSVHEMNHMQVDTQINTPELNYYSHLPYGLSMTLDESITRLNQLESIDAYNESYYDIGVIKLLTVLKPFLVEKVGQNTADQVFAQIKLGDFSTIVSIFGGWDAFRAYLQDPTMFGSYYKIDEIQYRDNSSDVWKKVNFENDREIFLSQSAELLLPNGIVVPMQKSIISGVKKKTNKQIVDSKSRILYTYDNADIAEEIELKDDKYILLKEYVSIGINITDFSSRLIVGARKSKEILAMQSEYADLLHSLFVEPDDVVSSIHANVNPIAKTIYMRSAHIDATCILGQRLIPQVFAESIGTVQTSYCEFAGREGLLYSPNAVLRAMIGNANGQVTRLTAIAKSLAVNADNPELSPTERRMWHFLGQIIGGDLFTYMEKLQQTTAKKIRISDAQMEDLYATYIALYPHVREAIARKNEQGTVTATYDPEVVYAVLKNTPVEIRELAVRAVSFMMQTAQHDDAGNIMSMPMDIDSVEGRRHLHDALAYYNDQFFAWLSLASPDGYQQYQERLSGRAPNALRRDVSDVSSLELIFPTIQTSASSAFPFSTQVVGSTPSKETMKSLYTVVNGDTVTASTETMSVILRDPQGRTDQSERMSIMAEEIGKYFQKHELMPEHLMDVWPQDALRFFLREQLQLMGIKKETVELTFVFRIKDVNGQWIGVALTNTDEPLVINKEGSKAVRASDPAELGTVALAQVVDKFKSEWNVYFYPIPKTGNQYVMTRKNIKSIQNELLSTMALDVPVSAYGEKLTEILQRDTKQTPFVITSLTWTSDKTEYKKTDSDFKIKTIGKPNDAKKSDIVLPEIGPIGEGHASTRYSTSMRTLEIKPEEKAFAIWIKKKGERLAIKYTAPNAYRSLATGDEVTFSYASAESASEGVTYVVAKLADGNFAFVLSSNHEVLYGLPFIAPENEPVFVQQKANRVQGNTGCGTAYDSFLTVFAEEPAEPVVCYPVRAGSLLQLTNGKNIRIPKWGIYVQNGLHIFSPKTVMQVPKNGSITIIGLWVWRTIQGTEITNTTRSITVLPTSSGDISLRASASPGDFVNSTAHEEHTRRYYKQAVMEHAAPDISLAAAKSIFSRLYRTNAPNRDEANRLYIQAWIIMHTLVANGHLRAEQIPTLYAVRVKGELRYVFSFAQTFITHNHTITNADGLTVHTGSAPAETILTYMQQADPTLSQSDISEVVWNASSYPFMPIGTEIESELLEKDITVDTHAIAQLVTPEKITLLRQFPNGSGTGFGVSQIVASDQFALLTAGVNAEEVERMSGMIRQIITETLDLMSGDPPIVKIRNKIDAIRSENFDELIRNNSALQQSVLEKSNSLFGKGVQYVKIWLNAFGLYVDYDTAFKAIREKVNTDVVAFASYMSLYESDRSTFSELDQFDATRYFLDMLQERYNVQLAHYKGGLFFRPLASGHKKDPGGPLDYVIDAAFAQSANQNITFLNPIIKQWKERHVYVLQPWYLNYLQPDMKYTSYTDLGITEEDIPLVNLSSRPQEDQHMLANLTGLFQKYLRAPLVTDTFTDHVSQRRPWLSALRSRITQERTQSDATDFIRWISTNKLSGGEISQMTSHVLTLQALGIFSFSSELLEQANTLQSYFLNNSERYDSLTNEEKLTVVQDAISFAKNGLKELASASVLESTNLPKEEPSEVHSKELKQEEKKVSTENSGCDITISLFHQVFAQEPAVLVNCYPIGAGSLLQLTNGDTIRIPTWGIYVQNRKLHFFGPDTILEVSQNGNITILGPWLFRTIHGGDISLEGKHTQTQDIRVVEEDPVTVSPTVVSDAMKERIKLLLGNKVYEAVAGVISQNREGAKKEQDLLDALAQYMVDANYNSQLEKISLDKFVADVRGILGEHADEFIQQLETVRDPIHEVFSPSSLLPFIHEGWSVDARFDISNSSNINQAYTSNVLGDYAFRFGIRAVLDVIDRYPELRGNAVIVHSSGDEHLILTRNGYNLPLSFKSEVERISKEKKIIRKGFDGLLHYEDLGVHFSDVKFPIEKTIPSDGNVDITPKYLNDTKTSKRLFNYHPEMAFIVDRISQIQVKSSSQKIDIAAGQRVMSYLQWLFERIYVDDIMEQGFNQYEADRISKPHYDREHIFIYKDFRDFVGGIKQRGTKFKLLKLDFIGNAKRINDEISYEEGNRFIQQQLAKTLDMLHAQGIQNVRIFRRASEFYIALEDGEYAKEFVDISDESVRKALNGTFTTLDGRSFYVPVSYAFTDLKLVKDTIADEILPDGTRINRNIKNMGDAYDRLRELSKANAYRYLQKVLQTESMTEPMWDFVMYYFNPNDKRGIMRISDLAISPDDLIHLQTFYADQTRYQKQIRSILTTVIRNYIPKQTRIISEKHSTISLKKCLVDAGVQHVVYAQDAGGGGGWTCPPFLQAPWKTIKTYTEQFNMPDFSIQKILGAGMGLLKKAGKWTIGLFPFSCRTIVYMMLHDIDQGVIHTEYAKDAFPTIFKGEAACTELMKNLISDSQLIIIGDTSVTRVVDGEVIRFYLNNSTTAKNLGLEQDSEKKPAFIIEPIANGIIVPLTDLATVQAAYASLGKTLQDPVSVVYLGTVGDGSTYKYNGTFVLKTGFDQNNIWVMSNGQQITAATSINPKDLYPTAVQIQTLYDYRDIYDLSYATRNNELRLLSQLSQQFNDYIYNNSNSFAFQGYINMVGFDKTGKPVHIFVDRSVFYNLELQQEFRENLEKEGIQHQVAISDVVESTMISTNTGNSIDESTQKPVADHTWNGIINNEKLNEDTPFVIIR